MADELTLIFYDVRERITNVYTLNGNRREAISAISKHLGLWRWHETHWERAKTKLYGIVFYEKRWYPSPRRTADGHQGIVGSGSP
jgi:hypothetical protein